MNQILSVEMNKKAKKADIKNVIIVFAICIILFGICIASGATYAVYKSQATGKVQQSEKVEQNNEEQEPVVQEANIQINLTAVTNKIKASITGDNEISFITYKWDDGEETRQDINSVAGEIEIDIPEGQHTLTIIAVDTENNTKTKTQDVKGIKKPTLSVTRNEGKFTVKASDETGLDRIEFTLNGTGYLIRAQDQTEREFSYSLVEGENNLEVTVYNTNGASETFSALWEF
jgi:hypothetical protein